MYNFCNVRLFSYINLIADINKLKFKIVYEFILILYCS